MIRVDRSELTRHEIVRLAANRFLNDGYSATSIHSMCKQLNMSTGNLTFHYPTKEHLLAELVDLLCDFQWKRMEEEAAEGHSSLLAICLELLSIAAACEQDEVAKDFILSAYRSPISLDLIRKNDKERAKKVFREFCPDWTDDQFQEAETLVSGIEYATLMTTEDSGSLELRVTGALNAILTIYQVPEELRAQKIKKVQAIDYRKLGLSVLKEFREYVDHETAQALFNLLNRKQIETPS